MAAAIGIRTDYSAEDLRRFARASRDARQVRRLLALAAVLDGGSRMDAARVGGVTRQIVRDWVLRFNAEGPDGLIDRKAPGKPSLLTPPQRMALADAVEAGPRPYLDGVVRWRLVDLAQWLWNEFGVSASETTISRELRALGYAKLSARPQALGQDPQAIEEFKKASPTSWRRSGRAHAAERSRYGSRMRRGSVRRTS